MTVYEYFPDGAAQYREIEHPDGNAAQIFGYINRHEMKPGEHIYLRVTQHDKVMMTCVDNWRDFEAMNRRMTNGGLSFDFVLVGEEQHHAIMRDGAHHLLHTGHSDLTLNDR